MQLLTLAGSIFLIVCSVAAQSTDKTGPCDKARQDAGPLVPGKFVPQCTEFGYFKPTQCHGSTGLCYCVDPESGKKIEGSDVFRAGEPQCTVCNVKRSEALRPSGTVGHFVPACDQDGLFQATQFHGSTGQSWCVNRFTGEELPGSRVGPGQKREKPCSNVSLLVGLQMPAILEEQGPCFEKTSDARGHENQPGFYLPGCTKNGFYKSEQRHSSSGYSWCVNPTTGVEIKGTRRGPTEQQADCGACFKEIEEKLSKKPLLGNHLPQCNDENGDYVPVQRREGYSYCVNPKTGAVEGKIISPGDKTPLPCVNN